MPLKGVTFEHDPIRHEALKQAGQMKFIETVQLHQEEVKFSKQSELNRYGCRWIWYQKEQESIKVKHHGMTQ